MSILDMYNRGLANEEVSVPVSVAGEPERKMPWLFWAVLAGVIGLAYLLLRSKPQQGPDTSDIEARILARGLDPYTYGLTDRRSR